MRIFGFALGLIVMFSGLSALTMAAGTLREVHPILAHFDACDRPCWNGIMPGVTTMFEANAILRQNGYRTEMSESSVYQATYSGLSPRIECKIQLIHLVEIIDVVVIYMCGGGLPAGEIMAHWGAPSGIYSRTGSDFIAYAQGKMNLVPSPDWSSPFNRTTMIHVRAERYEGILQWRGFVPRWRYCQLEQAAFGC